MHVSTNIVKQVREQSDKKTAELSSQNKVSENFTIKVGVKDRLLSEIKVAFNLKDSERFDRAIKNLNGYINKVIVSTTKSCLPIEERVLEVFENDSTRSKFNINPVTGKCTLKIGMFTKSKDRERLVSFAEAMMKLDLPPYGHRGLIHRGEDYFTHGLTCVLTSKRAEHTICKSKWMHLVQTSTFLGLFPEYEDAQIEE